MTTARQTPHPATGRGADLGPQRRTFTVDALHFRSTPDGTGGNAGVFTGYACCTDVTSQMWDAAGTYPETVRSGAFRGTLAAKPDVKLLLNHTGLPLARTTGGSLDLAEDSKGLHVQARLNTDHTEFRYVRSAIERGDLNAMSFAFTILTPNGGWNDEYSERNITAVDLNGGDVAIVNDPASEHTAGTIDERNLERFLDRLTPGQAQLARRRLTRGQAIPDDLAEHIARAAALRSGATGRHTRKSHPPMNDETRQAIAWVLRQQSVQ